MRRKFVLSLIMSLVLIISFITPVNANETNYNYYDFEGVVFTQEELERLAANDANLALLGNSLIHMRSNITLSIPRLAQYDTRWGSHRMNNGATISSQGCLLTSFTMVARFHGNPRDPGQMNTLLGNNVAPFLWDNAVRLTPNILSIHSAAGPIFPGPNPTIADTRTTAVAAITQSRPIIIGIGNPGSGSSNHWVVGHGFIGSEILVRDPGSASIMNLTQALQRWGGAVISRVVLDGTRSNQGIICDPITGICIFASELES